VSTLLLVDNKQQIIIGTNSPFIPKQATLRLKLIKRTENSRDVICLVGASLQDAYFFVKGKQARSRENYFHIQNFARNSLASY
jgi:hypothetical protein